MTAGRTIFALSFNRSRLDATFFPSKIENTLVSYHYLRRKDPAAHASAMHLLKRISKKSKVLMIDSGIFTLKAKYMGAHVGGKLGTMPADQMAELNRQIRKKTPFFVQFAKDYANWLAKYDKLYTWAFDLDVDQFLGIAAADAFYAHLCKKVPNPRKIIRIWHSVRPFSTWKEWCANGQHDYLAVEGGGSHGRDPHFYQRFIDVAHSYGIKVHVLAATDARFLASVPVDTGDSSSWMVGSRYGYIYSPWGPVSFGQQSKRHWNSLVPEQKKQLQTWLKENNLEHRPEVLSEDWVEREFINIEYYLWMDRHYDPRGKVKRGTFLE